MAETDGITLAVKACKFCGVTKPLDAFLPSQGRTLDGRLGHCRACDNERRQARIRADPDGLRKQAEATRRAKARLSPEERRRRKTAEAKRRAERAGRTYHGAEGLAAHRAAQRTEAAAQHEARKAAKAAEMAAQKDARVRAKPWLAPNLSAAERWAIRYRLDPAFNLRERVRTALRHERAGIKLGELLRSALRRGGSSPKAASVLGYTIEDLRVHIERQFEAGMDWPTFLTGAIHLDHIVPLASFDLADGEEVRAAWSLPNLRPMWSKGNIAKGSDRVLLL